MDDWHRDHRFNWASLRETHDLDGFDGTETGAATGGGASAFDWGFGSSVGGSLDGGLGRSFFRGVR